MASTTAVTATWRLVSAPWPQLWAPAAALPLPPTASTGRMASPLVPRPLSWPSFHPSAGVEDDGVSAVVHHHQLSGHGAAAAATASKTPTYRLSSSNNNTININKNEVTTSNSNIADEHSYHLESSQVEGIWPVEHPLPLPAWQCDARPVLPLVSLADYDDLVHEIEAHVQRLLEQHNYNTVGNLIDLYDHYQHSGCNNLAEFFQSYSPPITPDHHTCVGLAMELWHKLHQITPTLFKNTSRQTTQPTTTTQSKLGDYLYLVSCEESIGEYSEYCGLYGAVDDTADVMEKEHVMLACRFQMCDTGREGVMLCDPGYHVGRVVTVMLDGYHPHTGTFIQAQESATTIKTYSYNFSPFNPDFIEWTEQNTRAGKTEEIHSLIYIHRPYLTAVDVTERRNLVYNFRSLLSRDVKGHVLAGIYFKVKMAGNWDEFTVFYKDGTGVKQRVKWNWGMFKQLERLSEGVLKIIRDCNEQLNLTQGELLHTLATLANILYDRTYIQQMLDINNCINLMTEV